jgi:hypothetical protein
MRADQLEKMRALQERLAEVFFGECEPETWPALDTQQGRGDRYWLKKNAQASLVLIGRIENLLALRDGRASGGGPTEGEQQQADEAHLDREIAEAEKEAARLGRNVVELRRGGRKAKG